MKTSKKFKFTSMALVMFFVVLSLFAFGNNKGVEKNGLVMGWTKSLPSAICDQEFTVNCSSTTWYFVCKNIAGEDLYERRGVACPLSLYRSMH